MVRRLLLTLVAVAGIGLLALTPSWSPGSPVEAIGRSGPLPERLSDEQFWDLSTGFSEPNGSFRSENLVSNEHTFQYVIPALERRVRGGVYLGVAPDQNFTYIVAVKPKMAFIVDIRRGNLLEHLMYKAIIELSADRAEFLSRLFSKKRPEGLRADSTVEALFAAFAQVEQNEPLYRDNVQAIEHHLIDDHGFRLSTEDLQQLEGIYWQFFWEGPGLRYTMNFPLPGAYGGGFGGFGRRNGGFWGNFPTYQDLAEQSDWDGRARSYLASEEAFAYLKAFEEKNLLVPVVGNFAGPKALRAVGRYVREHGEIVSAFYVSNVEQYLFQDGIWTDFYRNVSTLPVGDSSVFIRSVSSRMGYNGPRQWSDGRATVLDPIKTSVRDFLGGRIRRYYDINTRGQ
jgi:hypothetical protein